jgi:fused signal recognition particle receptor
MFGALKQKLKEWTNKFVKKESEIAEQEEEKELSKKPKKEAKKEEKSYERKEKKKQDNLKPIEEISKEESIEESPLVEKEPKKDVQEEVGEKKGFFHQIKSKIQTVEFSESDFSDQFEDLELSLLESNVALEAIDEIKSKLKSNLVGKKILKKEVEGLVHDSLRDSLEELLIQPFDILDMIRNKVGSPYVIVFFGINGSGKTTTIAKLANYLKQNKISCVLAAGDTFRAASIEQLEKHGEKLDIKVIKQQYGSDPASVGFDAIKYAKSHNIECVLIDTAGRMHTQVNLLKEMEKIIRVTKPDLKVFIAESITGNDAIEQAKQFNESAGIVGSILTKVDVDEKGGTIISISYITKKPILFIGVGQEYKDIEKFDKYKFLDRLGL